MYRSAPANEVVQYPIKLNPGGSETQVSCRDGRWDEKSKWFIGLSVFRAEESSHRCVFLSSLVRNVVAEGGVLHGGDTYPFYRWEVEV